MSEKGTIFDLEETEGDWFDFFESTIDFTSDIAGAITYLDSESGTGRVRFRSPRKFLESCIEKRKTESEFVLNPKTRSMEKVTTFKSMSPADARKENEDRIDYVITGIEKFFDKKGKPIECTRENKILLSKVPVFDRFMAKCMEIQENAMVKHEEKEGKNSVKP